MDREESDKRLGKEAKKKEKANRPSAIKHSEMPRVEENSLMKTFFSDIDKEALKSFRKVSDGVYEKGKASEVQGYAKQGLVPTKPTQTEIPNIGIGYSPKTEVVLPIKNSQKVNKSGGITQLSDEPSVSQKPDIRWRLYVFEGEKLLDEPLYIHQKALYLFGREKGWADVLLYHRSCSRRHAATQYRRAEKEPKKQARPYMMDLGSTNGTYVNNKRIESLRYYELHEKDLIQFGASSQQFVLLHENSAD